jgi:hypothetical protein
VRYLRAFAAFWYDFLIGDRPELFGGSLVVLGLVWLAISVGFSPTAAGGLLTILILFLAGLSIGSASRPRR